LDDKTKENPHRPFQYEVDGSKTAVLMVHGILGSPAQFEDIARALHGQGYAVMAVLLPGHGGSAHTFAKAETADWQREVRRAVLLLRQRYQRVFIIGHSMGGLLAMIEAAGHHADGVILMSTPMRLKAGFKALRISLRILLGDPEKDDEVLQCYRKANSVQKGPFWVYPLWIPRMASVLTLMRKARRLLGRVHGPVLIIQSRRDETVSWKSQSMLAGRLKAASVESLLIEKSGHSWFHPDEAKTLQEKIARFLAEHSARPG
jgi:carboxylesterase